MNYTDAFGRAKLRPVMVAEAGIEDRNRFHGSPASEFIVRDGKKSSLFQVGRFFEKSKGAVE